MVQFRVMSSTDLSLIAKKMMERGKGILAADESTRSANEKRLALVGIEGTEENRRRFREILFTAPGVEEHLSGVILYDETLHHTTSTKKIPLVDVLIARGIIPGIKVDRGLRPLTGFDGETVTQGLDDLAERFEEYYKMGCRFAKWRAAFSVADTLPSTEVIEINAIMHARYASLAQAAGIVPIVEPEVLYPGSHTIERAEEVTTNVLKIVFDTLLRYKVDLRGIVLKSSMVLAGKDDARHTPEEVASATLQTFKKAVPEDVAGIVFLSGGQTAEQATQNLNAIAKQNEGPWPITFSYSRAIQVPMLEAWRGEEANVETAQKVLLEKCAENAKASLGQLA